MCSLSLWEEGSTGIIVGNDSVGKALVDALNMPSRVILLMDIYFEDEKYFFKSQANTSGVSSIAWTPSLRSTGKWSSIHSS